MGQIVTADYFHALGVSPILGRDFSAEETALFNPSPVAVVSYRLWRRRFGGEGSCRANHRTRRPSIRHYRRGAGGLEGIDTLTATDVWLPVSMYADVYPNPRAVTERRALLFKAVGRLKPGVSRERAESSMEVLAKDLEREFRPRTRGGASN